MYKKINYKVGETMNRVEFSDDYIIKYAEKTLSIEGQKLKKSDKAFLEKYAKGLVTQKEVFDYAKKELLKK